MAERQSEAVHFSFQPGAGLLSRNTAIELAVDTGASAPPDVILFSGFGNEGVAGETIRQLRKLGECGVVAVDCLPFQDTEPNEPGFTRLVVAAGEAIHRHASEQHGLQPEFGIVGQSMGAFSALTSAGELPDVYAGDIGLLEPVGFQGPITKPDFIWRMARTGLQPGVINAPVSAKVARHAVHRVVDDHRRTRGEALSAALQWDALPLFSKITDDQERPRTTRVYAGDADIVFPFRQIRRGLGHYADLLYLVRGPHSSPASEIGAKQVARVTAQMRAS